MNGVESIMKAIFTLGSILPLANCIASNSIQMDSLFKSNAALLEVEIVGCVVADRISQTGNHAFFSATCPSDLKGELSEKFLSHSVDLVPKSGYSGIFKEINGCYVIQGDFVPYGTDPIGDHVVPSGSLLSSHGLIEVTSIKKMPTNRCE